MTHFQIWVNLGWVVSCAEFSWGYTTPNLSFGQRNGSNYGHGVNPVNPVNQVSGSRETRCKTFMKQMAGDVFGEAFLDLYWPVNLLHCAIYICFGVSLSYSFLWFSRFAQAQCGKYRIFGGSTANCTFEVVGFLVYVWMTCLSVKLGTPPLEKVLPFNFQSITQNLFACFFGNFLGNALKKGLFFHWE